MIALVALGCAHPAPAAAWRASTITVAAQPPAPYWSSAVPRGFVVDLAGEESVAACEDALARGTATACSLGVMACMGIVARAGAFEFQVEPELCRADPPTPWAWTLSKDGGFVGYVEVASPAER